MAKTELSNLNKAEITDENALRVLEYANCKELEQALAEADVDDENDLKTMANAVSYVLYQYHHDWKKRYYYDTALEVHYTPNPEESKIRYARNKVIPKHPRWEVEYSENLFQMLRRLNIILIRLGEAGYKGKYTPMI